MACRSGHRTPPHVTLVAPFSFDDLEEFAFLRTPSRDGAEERGFRMRARRFWHHLPTDVFARVVDRARMGALAYGLVRALNAASPGMLPLTVASSRRIFRSRTAIFRQARFPNPCCIFRIESP
jgi:hypothetical protein